MHKDKKNMYRKKYTGNSTFPKTYQPRARQTQNVQKWRTNTVFQRDDPIETVFENARGVNLFNGPNLTHTQETKRKLMNNEQII